MFKRSRKAQSTLEYIVVFAAVIVAILAVAYTVLRPAMEGVMNSAADRITKSADQMNTSNAFD